MVRHRYRHGVALALILLMTVSFPGQVRSEDSEARTADANQSTAQSITGSGAATTPQLPQPSTPTSSPETKNAPPKTFASTVRDYVTAIPDSLNKIVLFLTIFYFGIRPFFRLGFRSFLLLFVFYRPEQTPLFSALGSLARLYYFCLPGIHNPKRLTLLFDATRIAIEWELLNKYDDVEDREVIGGPRKWWPRYWMAKRRRRAWLRKRDARIREFIELADKSSDYSALPPVKVPNVFSLTNRSDEAERYFEAILIDAEVTRNRRRFLSSIEFSCGYVAPIYLVCGTLSRFEDDWTFLHKCFLLESTQDESENGLSYEMERVRLHEFHCWLLWGPSICICRECAEWRSSHAHSHGTVALQFGFGDENNSLPLLPAHQESTSNQSSSFGNLMENSLKRLSGNPPPATPPSTNPAMPPAMPRSITARPVWAVADHKTMQISDSELQESVGCICSAQSDITSPDGPKIILDYINDKETVEVKDGEGYYSAYLWIMLYIEPIKKSSKKETGESKYLFKRLFPIFEHANIANISTYQQLKKALVSKAAFLVRRILNDQESRLLIRVVAASDWNGHTEAPNDTLADLLEKEIGSRCSLPLRFSINPEWNNSHDIHSCLLPKIITDFFGSMEEHNTETDPVNLSSRFLDGLSKIDFADDPRVESLHWGLPRESYKKFIKQRGQAGSTQPVVGDHVIGCFSGTRLVGWCWFLFRENDSPQSILFCGLGVFSDDHIDEIIENMRNFLFESSTLKRFVVKSDKNKPTINISAIILDPEKRNKGEKRNKDSADAQFPWNDNPYNRRILKGRCIEFLRDLRSSSESGGSDTIVSLRDLAPQEFYTYISKFDTPQPDPEGIRIEEHFLAIPVSESQREAVFGCARPGRVFAIFFCGGSQKVEKVKYLASIPSETVHSLASVWKNFGDDELIRVRDRLADYLWYHPNPPDSIENEDFNSFKQYLQVFEGNGKFFLGSPQKLLVVLKKIE